MLIVLALLTSVYGFLSLASAQSEQFQGYNKETAKWVNANLGSAYVEGDFVSYQLKIESSSPIWGHDFQITYNFHQDASSAIYIDGFDVSVPTGFQYTSTNAFLPDGTDLPPAGWGSHIQTPVTGDPVVTTPKIVNYMDPWPVGTTDGTPAGSNPADTRYFTVSGLPWNTFSSGYVILFYRAHLALTIIWSNGLESDLPQLLDGNVFESWTTPWFGSSAATGSSRHFELEFQGVGQKTIPIPIAQYPSTLISGHKYVGGVLFDGWEITLTGLLDLGPNLPAIPYFPPAVLTGEGTFSSGAAWGTGYYEFTGLVTGQYVVTEEDRVGFGHADIVVGGDATNVVEDVSAGTASFDLQGGASATIDFYNSVDTQTMTELSATSIVLGDSVYDTATVTATGVTPTGDVQFYVKVDGGAWAPLGTPVLLVNGEATSISYTPMSTGSYWFKASYSPTTLDFAPSESGDTDEPLTVEPATPSVTTLLSSSSITLGGTVHDVATVTGLGGTFPVPTGTVQFYVKEDANAWLTLGAAVPLLGGQATSIDYTPLIAGSYWFKATYSGDSNYNGASSGETSEPLEVGPATPSVVTVLSSDSITLGGKIHDTVTVTGLGGSFPAPTGSVQFYVKVDNGAWTTLGGQVNLVNGHATSIDYSPLAVGDYWFKATYSGDANYVGASSGETSEPLEVGPPAPTVTTELSDVQITLGASVNDVATVTGLAPPFPAPTGTVQFSVKADGGAWLPLGGPVALVNGHATSISYTPLAAGSYWFKATYSGDSNYNGASSGETDEPLSVGPATPVVSTVLSESSGTLGGTVHDTATVAGLAPPFPMPAGTVQFYVKVDGGAWGPLGGPVALVNGQATSIDYTPLAAGDYWFMATYSGDSNYFGASSGETDEPLVIGAATPTVTTELSSSSITLGGTVFDTAIVSGLAPPFPPPTGSVQFYVRIGLGPWTPLGASVALVNGMASSIGYTPVGAGSYSFMATYSGDSNYLGASSGEQDEPLVVGPATPTVRTLLSESTITLGESVYDTATVIGLGGVFPVPSGTVQFYVRIGLGVWTPLGGLVPLVNGQATSIAYAPLAAGSYWFMATYSGDTNYVGASSGENDEPLTVEPATPTVTTLLSSDSITLGGAVHDVVTVSGLAPPFPAPTGTVQFYVKSDGGAWVPLGGAVSLVSGQATSIDYSPLAAGNYWFMATYSGDLNYIGASSGETDEPLEVGPATPTVTTLLSSSSITLGDAVYDTATVTGLAPPFPAPSGTVQFYVKVGAGLWTPLGAPVALVGGEAVSIDYTPLAAGSYWFKATYSGDSNYNGASSGETDEPLSVAPATPTVTTLLSSTTISWGQSVHDTATVTGLAPPFPAPTGTVQFYVMESGGSWTTLGSPVALVNGQAVSIDYTPATGGTFYFKAVYSGDSNYGAASSGDTDEPLTVTNMMTRTLGYWKTHASKWVGLNPNSLFPWTTGRAAGKTYIQILSLQPKGDASIILAHQYIAAVLNENAFGAPTEVQDWIAQAEYIFSHGYPVGSNPPPSDPVRSEMITLAGLLDDYNNSGDM